MNNHSPFVAVPAVNFTGGGYQPDNPGFTNRFSSDGGLPGNQVRFSGKRGHKFTGGTFTVAGSPLTTTVDTSFHERGGGDLFEGAIEPIDNSSPEFNNGAVQDSPFGSWRILGDGQCRWAVTNSISDTSFTPNNAPALTRNATIVGTGNGAMLNGTVRFGDLPLTPHPWPEPHPSVDRTARAGNRGDDCAKAVCSIFEDGMCKEQALMTLAFEAVLTQGTAQLSYLIGDDSTGTAAVIDPRPDVEVYLEIARRKQVAITHVFDTHNHADFMSGARELNDRVGGAKVCMSGVEPPDYGFEHEPVRDGDRFTFGQVVLMAKHTPGHTPEHLSFLISEKDRPDEPWGVFSGDSLFVGSAGRPDLMSDEQSEELAEKLYHTLYGFYKELDDGVIVYPGHGAGSACGADIGDRPMSTIGYERRTNEALRQKDLKAFKRFIEEGAPPEPAHYSRLKKVNARGAPVLGRLPAVQGLPPASFKKAMDESGVTVLDTRDMLAFGGGHVPGAINIGDRPELSNWAGDMLDPDRALLLVLYDERQLDEIVARLLRVGFTRFRGYLVGGMAAWDGEGFALDRIEQLTVRELERQKQDLQILDVRSPSEWDSGRIAGAVHKYVGEMRDGIDGVDGLKKDKPTAVYCGSGYRASIAASIMQRDGYRDVRNVPGSWEAWQSQDLPVEGGKKG